MYYTLKTNKTRTLFILSTSDTASGHNHNTLNPSHYDHKRTPSLLGSPSYIRSQRRAFARAKMLAFFNSDLDHFVTFTYKQNMLDPDQAMSDMKYFLKQQKRSLAKQGSTKQPKYIYVFERQKRGAIHMHMVCNDAFLTRKNKNGYDELLHWEKGYTSVLRIKQLDKNFKPYLYLFKYMAKSQRIGKSFVHVSRNFDKIEPVDYAHYIERLNEGNVLFKEDIEFLIHDRKSRITKEYITTLQSSIA